ncbi:oxidoreductase [Aliidongia dinghuensis]|uniref:Oxidoreductase n=1 Tax=Aliidongia dinghuensis TaxID=1867774 RepID=A0A8J3E575_9PROT|nr:Gfo/Idh/MocA family oxidoreductase [Aliidongia dinghuensis]GGF44872.1 oxidoreductase [Aliidongia dinghuensis]
MLRGALIGCGFFAVNQLHAWRDVAGARIVALCDRDGERLQGAGRRFGIDRLYDDAAALFAGERLDFVDIATTVPSHRPLVELAARHSVPVICQKPLAATLEDAAAMTAACAAAGIPMMVHENFRWQTPIQAVGRIIASGRIGEVFWGRVSFRSAYDVFSGQPYLATGERFIIEDLGIHMLDIARFLFGEVDRLTARTRRVNPAIRGEDVATILLGHSSGATSIVDCSYATRLETEPFPETVIEVDGSHGTIRLQQGYRMIVTDRSGTERYDAAPRLLPWAEPPWHAIQESVLAIQQHWADCLRTGHEPATSGRDNLKTLALVDAAYRSAETGWAITPEPPAP